MTMHRQSLTATIFATLLLLGLQGCSWISPAVTPAPLRYDLAPGADQSWVLETRDDDHLLLFGQWWLPDDKPVRAVVLLLHGTSVHSGFYHPMGEYYAAQGVAVFGIDFRGWGQSQGHGRRGHITSYDDYLTDVRTAAEEIRKHYPQTPLFVQGESMGGAIALLSAINNVVDAEGLVLNAPAVQPGLFIGPLRTPRFLADGSLAVLSVPGRLASNMPIPIHWRSAEYLGVGLFLREEENQQRYLHDPLAVHRALPWSYLSSLHAALKEIRAGLDDINEPVLIQQGTKDMLIPVSSSRYAYENIGSSRKGLEIYEGLTHATLHDRQREKVWQDALDWMTETLTLRSDAVAMHPHGDRAVKRP
ncbi:MAG: lysophospholipase [Alcanivoracaceae bacterium]|nr:lysophospholipase [Alcanivoracaceae bacterium]